MLGTSIWQTSSRKSCVDRNGISQGSMGRGIWPSSISSPAWPWHWHIAKLLLFLYWALTIKPNLNTHIFNIWKKFNYRNSLIKGSNSQVALLYSVNVSSRYCNNNTTTNHSFTLICRWYHQNTTVGRLGYFYNEFITALIVDCTWKAESADIFVISMSRAALLPWQHLLATASSSRSCASSPLNGFTLHHVTINHQSYRTSVHWTHITVAPAARLPSNQCHQLTNCYSQ